jgi:lysophospholipase L1-like esterase
MELGLRIFQGPIELRRNYRWLVGTHLVDMSYSEFRHEQERIRGVRALQGMERGRSHPEFGWTYNPTFRIDLPEDGIEIHINSHALRGEEFAERKSTGEIRVLCLGGSTTAGEGVREAETYPAQLDVILRQRYPGLDIRVINAGVPTYDVKKSFTHYCLRLFKYEPDIVTIYHGYNDLLYHTDGGLDISPKRNYNGRLLESFVLKGDTRRSWLFESIRPLLRQSYLLLPLRSALKEVANAVRGWRTAPDQGGIETFATYYRALVRQISSTGATPIPMTFAVPYPGQFEDQDQEIIEASFRVMLQEARIPLEVGKQIIDLQNQRIIDLGREIDVPVCDVASAVPPDRTHFIDSCHLTAEGNHRIAQAMAETIMPLLDRVAARARARGDDAGM